MLFITINGCEKNPVIEEIKEYNGQFAVEQAQAWYDSKWKGALNLKSGHIETQIGIKPDWCDGSFAQNSRFEVVEVGLLVQGRFGFVDETSYKDWKTNKEKEVNTSITRMVFLKYRKNNRIDQFLMTIVGDKDYHTKKVGRLADNSYLSTEKCFSGYIFYHDFAGNFVNGWRYSEGKIVRKCSQKGGPKFSPVLKKADCTAVTVTLYSQFCTDWYTNGQYNYTTCEDRVAEDEFYYLSCAYDPSGGEEGGYGGGGSEYYPPEPVSVAIVDADDLKNNLKADCIYQKLINGEILSSFISRYFGLTQPEQSFLGELNLTWTLGSTTETLPIGVPRNGVYNSVEIRLNETALNTNSSTNVALSMLHEALHAKLIAEFYDSVGSTDFRTLYASYRGWGLGNMDNQQEFEMVTDYSNRMGQALQDFDRTQGINHTLDFYIEAIKYSLSEEIGLDRYLSGQDEYSTLYYSNKNCIK